MVVAVVWKLTVSVPNWPSIVSAAPKPEPVPCTLIVSLPVPALIVSVPPGFTKVVASPCVEETSVRPAVPEFVTVIVSAAVL